VSADPHVKKESGDKYVDPSTSTENSSLHLLDGWMDDGWIYGRMDLIKNVFQPIRPIPVPPFS
jgi:hypothetical protein